MYEQFIETYLNDNEYEIIDHIGKGAYGYILHIQKGDNIYAAKIQKFKTVNFMEIDILLRLKHSNIVGANIDIIHNEDNHYLIMIMKYGESIQSAGRNIDTYKLLVDIIMGVQYLHQNGFYHGDLNMNNIISVDGVGSLIDFSLCGCTNTHLFGTIYARPIEYLEGNGKLCDPYKADMWSLGLIIYTMLTGNDLTYISGIQEEDNDVMISHLEYIFKNLDTIMKDDNCSASEIEVIRGLICRDSNQRMSINDVINTNWFKDMPSWKGTYNFEPKIDSICQKIDGLEEYMTLIFSNYSNLVTTYTIPDIIKMLSRYTSTGLQLDKFIIIAGIYIGLYGRSNTGLDLRFISFARRKLKITGRDLWCGIDRLCTYLISHGGILSY